MSTIRSRTLLIIAIMLFAATACSEGGNSSDNNANHMANDSQSTSMKTERVAVDVGLKGRLQQGLCRSHGETFNIPISVHSVQGWQIPRQEDLVFRVITRDRNLRVEGVNTSVVFDNLVVGATATGNIQFGAEIPDIGHVNFHRNDFDYFQYIRLENNGGPTRHCFRLPPEAIQRVEGDVNLTTHR